MCPVHEEATRRGFIQTTALRCVDGRLSQSGMVIVAAGSTSSLLQMPLMPLMEPISMQNHFFIQDHACIVVVSFWK